MIMVADDDHPQPQPRRSACPETKRGLGFSQLVVLVISSILLGYSLPIEYRMLRVQEDDVYSATASVIVPKLDSVYYLSSAQETFHQQKPRLRVGAKPTSTSSNNTTTNLKIAWLMSFPNSGTSYTGKMIRHISVTSSASNYGVENLLNNESVPVFADQPTGPFFVDPEVHPEYSHPIDYIFTKTHCGGRCERCSPRKYVETTYSFRHRCLSGKWREMINGTQTIVRGHYPPDRVKKAVHLIRNPFDNVVSRFHLERRIGHGGQIGRDYESSREGFRAFCFNLNENYAQDETRTVWLTPELDALTADIPCRADFFRYVEWHNLAFVTTRDMNLETYVLHYDWYATRFEETVEELLEFLHLERRDAVLPFEVGKVYNDYFSAEERAKMKTAIQWMASPVLWEQLERYFEME